SFHDVDKAELERISRSEADRTGAGQEISGPRLAARAQQQRTERDAMMGGTGVIDRFLEVFTSYIDSGFGLLSSEVGFLASTLAAIDIMLAALFWSWGADEDMMARLV